MYVKDKTAGHTYGKKKSITPKSLSLDTYPFVCVELPGKVVSGKAPVALKSQHWAFPDKNVSNVTLCVSFQAIRLACGSFWKAWFFFLLSLKIQIFYFSSAGATVLVPSLWLNAQWAKQLKNPTKRGLQDPSAAELRVCSHYSMISYECMACTLTCQNHNQKPLPANEGTLIHWSHWYCMLSNCIIPVCTVW